ncbi:hypothetical protein MMC24_002975 [Lignoscripta atroalba]|nr:hypothetical protein [Lignoscripta atroalba]
MSIKNEDEASLPSSRSSPLIPRLILGTIISTAILFPDLYTPILYPLYGYLYNSSFYNFSGFETIETTFFYIVIEILYTVRFVRSPSKRLDVRQQTRSGRFDASNPQWPRMKRPSKRLLEIATYIAPLLTMDLVMIKKFAGVPIDDIRLSGGYEPTPEPSSGQISPSFLLPTIHNFSLHSPLQLRRALPPNPPTSRRLLLELILSFLIYDTLFFLIHLAFHRLPFLRKYHLLHHKHAEMNPQVTNQLSILERLSLVLLANFSLNIIGSHVLTRTAFVPVFVYLLVEVHCGLDLDWQFDKLLPEGWGAGSRKHAVHHRIGEGFYEPFFCWWDDGLGFVERSWKGRAGVDGPGSG